jgi:hypothetical protein
LVLIHLESAQVQCIVALQYNSQKLTPSLQVNAAGGKAADRSEAIRFKGPAVENIRLEADFDAADRRAIPDLPARRWGAVSPMPLPSATE